MPFFCGDKKSFEELLVTTKDTFIRAKAKYISISEEPKYRIMLEELIAVLEPKGLVAAEKSQTAGDNCSWMQSNHPAFRSKNKKLANF